MKKHTPCIHYLLTTFCIFSFYGLFILIPLNLDLFDPVKRAFADFQLSDIYIRLINKENKPESNIVFVVDIAQVRDRTDMAEVLATVAQTKPKVIALDVIFDTFAYDNDNISSFLLKQEIDNIKIPIVKAVEINDDSIISSYFSPFDSMSGYVNIAQDDSYRKSIRTYTTSYLFNGEEILSFPYLVAHQYKPDLKKESFKKKSINYMDVNICVIDHNDIQKYSDRLKDKIVILGIASGTEDMHLAPYGDENGAVIVGYAVQSILDGYDIREMSSAENAIFVFILTFLFVIFCTYVYFKYPITYNVITKTVLILVSIVLVFINLITNVVPFFYYNITLIHVLTCLVLASDIVVFYITILFSLKRRSWMRKRGWLTHYKKGMFV